MAAKLMHELLRLLGQEVAERVPDPRKRNANVLLVPVITTCAVQAMFVLT
jgi:hypothetical protein